MTSLKKVEVLNFPQDYPYLRVIAKIILYHHPFLSVLVQREIVIEIDTQYSDSFRSPNRSPNPRFLFDRIG